MKFSTQCGNGRVSDAVTSELGDRQSSHPVKTLLQSYGKSLEALPGVAYPGFRDNRSTLNTKTGFLKKMSHMTMTHTRLCRDQAWVVQMSPLP